MQIHGVEVVKADQIKEIYGGRLTIKERYIEYLDRDGYYFMANDFRTMDLGKKWGPYDPVLIASSFRQRPRYLWAVKPITRGINEKQKQG